jgi:superfamily I DNA/RNA helicase
MNNGDGLEVELAVTKDAFVKLSTLEYKVQRKVFELVDKFQHNPTSPGLHYEKLPGFADDRVRSLRVDQGWRAILVSPKRGNRHLLVWVDKHDEAYDWARHKRFDVHPKTGVLQIVDAAAVAAAVERSASPSTAPGDAGLFQQWSDDELMTLGVPAPLIPSVRTIKDVVGLHQLQPHLPEEVGFGLELLADGASLDVAREFTPPSKALDLEDFGPAIDNDVAGQRFVTLSKTGELASMLDGPLALWRVFLEPGQRRSVKANFNGPAKVLGGAGTGKTVVAMHRAKHLIEAVFPAADDRILFTTFSKALAIDVGANVSTLFGGDVPKRLEITHLHSWAARFLRAQGIDLHPASDADQRQLWKMVLDTEGLGRFTQAFIIAEWDEVVQPQGIRTRDAYLRASRRGRGGPRLNKADREALWARFERYRGALDDKRLVEYIDVVRLARERLALLEEQGTPRPYRAVIVDETQDLGPEELRLIRALAPPGSNDLYLVGDAHQRLYAAPVSMASCGIDVRGRSRKLRVNYRTTHEIRQWAVAMLKGLTVDNLDGEVDDLRGYVSRLSGPMPEVLWAKNTTDEQAQVIARLKDRLSKGAPADGLCVIAPRNENLDAYEAALAAAGLASVRVTGDGVPQDKGKVRLCTMHRAKGLEFLHVCIAGLGDDRFPRPIDAGLSDDPVAVAREQQVQRSLIFVAATRARETLTVSGWGVRAPGLP